MQIRWILSASLFVAIAGVAHANTVRYYTGTECESIEPGDASHLARYNEGCRNITAAPTCDDLNVILPISGNNSDTVDLENVQVRYYDGSSYEEVACTIGIRTSGGTTYTSATLGSGFATTGQATFTWPTSGALPNSGSSISNVYVQHIYCTVPSEYGFNDVCMDGGVTSEIRNYRVEAVGS